MEEILLVDKPAGMSSFGVVAKVRWLLSRREGKRVKVGHAGTLDPFATGLLVLLVGKGTKRAGEFLKLDKSYTAKVILGTSSTTGDPEGELEVEMGAREPSLEEVKRELFGMVGEIWQRVPAFSAVKIKGQRAYKLAREGVKVEMPEKKVKVYKLELLEYNYPELLMRCEVSSGTYIRVLGEDLAKRLGTVGYVQELRRETVGEWRVGKAESLEMIEKRLKGEKNENFMD